MRSLAAASLLFGFGHATQTGECPTTLRAPYMEEVSPFGWPLSPADWDFDHASCWEQKYLLCGGDKQSPMEINFEHTDPSCVPETHGDPGALKDVASYKLVTGNPTVKVSKYMRSVMVGGDFGTLTLKDRDGNDIKYKAQQVHLTSGSMHTMRGEHMDAELIVIHKPEGRNNALAGSVAVSLMFNNGSRSELLTQMGLDTRRSQVMWTAPQSINLVAAMASALEGTSYSYEGSVPVPPCSESVEWIILESVQQASEEQINHLKDILTTQAGGTSKRPPVARAKTGTTCRPIRENDVTHSSHHQESACETAHGSDKERAAACWSSSCGKTPIDIPTQANAPLGVINAQSTMHYAPTEHVSVKPSMYTLDATVHGGNFGYIMLNGRQFQAKTLMIKPIAMHTFDGERYAGELMIEHELFGDAMGGHDHRRRLETEGGNSHEEGSDSQTSAGPHKVILSVPLKLGGESPLLRHLGLGVSSHAAAIRDGNAYDVHEPVDLASGIEAASSGAWYWYSGSMPHGHTCNEWGVRWMIFKTPIEVSFEQLNSLHLQVSGVDSSPVTADIAISEVFASNLPLYAVELGTGTCDASSAWSYESPSCWGETATLCSEGTRQSPINILSSSIEMEGSDNFLSKTSWKPVAGLRAEGIDHGLGARNKQMGYVTLIGDNGFPDYYQVTGFDLKMPSEHMIDGKQFAAELQVMHKKQISVGELDDDAIMITSFLFNIGTENSTLLKQLHLPGHLPAADGFTEIPTPVDLMWAMGPALDGSFYHYPGSTTTPGCTESVKWVVFENHQTMSEQQYSTFQAAYSSNNRPMQPLNGRKIVKNSMLEGEPADYRFFLNRDEGRNRGTYSNSDSSLIVVPIIGTCILLTVVAYAMFAREDQTLQTKSAGGLEMVIGARSYDRM